MNLPYICAAVDQHTKVIVAHRAQAALNSRAKEINQAYLIQTGQNVWQLVPENLYVHSKLNYTASPQKLPIWVLDASGSVGLY